MRIPFSVLSVLIIAGLLTLVTMEGCAVAGRTCFCEGLRSKVPSDAVEGREASGAEGFASGSIGFRCSSLAVGNEGALRPRDALRGRVGMSGLEDCGRGNAGDGRGTVGEECDRGSS